MAASVGVVQNAKIRIVGLNDKEIAKDAARQYLDDQIYFRVSKVERIEDKVIEVELEPEHYR